MVYRHHDLKSFAAYPRYPGLPQRALDKICGQAVTVVSGHTRAMRRQRTNGIADTRQVSCRRRSGPAQRQQYRYVNRPPHRYIQKMELPTVPVK